MPISVQFPPLALAAALLVTGTIYAAPVSWQAPFNLTSVSGISTAGILVRAVNATTDASAPVVIVGAEAITFQPVSLGPGGVGTGTYFTGDGGDTGQQFIRLLAVPQP